MIKRNTILVALAFCLTATASQANDIFNYTLLEGEVVRDDSGETGLAWDGHGWIGGDVNKFSWETEGEFDGHVIEEAEVQVFYQRMISDFWDMKAGLRQNIEPDPLSYAAIGITGLAPYWFEVEAMAYLSENGDVSTRIDLEYELLFTRRLIGSPYIEIEAYANDVPELGMGSGLATTEVGFQLRYEITRKLAPYVDITYERAYGSTADMARAAGEDDASTTLRLGLRVIF